MLTEIVNCTEPGGYLQWIEIDVTSYLDGNAAQYPRFQEMMQPFFEFVTQKGLSKCASEVIYKSCKRAGLMNVVRDCSSVLEHPRLEGILQGWHLDSFASMLPRILLQTDQASSDALAEQSTARWLSDLQQLFDQGLVPGGTFGAVIGQKAKVAM